MFTNICLGILTAALVALVFVLLKISLQAKQSIQQIQTDIHVLSKEMIELLSTVNQFVRQDLHATSEETCRLINKLNDLSSDINNKSHSLNFLFKPLSFLSSKLGRDLPSGESSPKCESIPQILKWIVSSAFLFKTTKEFIKNYGKRT